MSNPEPSDGKLTLAAMLQAIDTLEARQTAAEADAFIRLGERYPIFRSLSHGGSVVIGNDPRTRQGEAMRDAVLAVCPWLTVHLTAFLPDGEARVLPPMLPMYGVPA